MGVYMDEIRQSPEHFLKEIEKEKQNLNRGHLKIFLAMPQESAKPMLC